MLYVMPFWYINRVRGLPIPIPISLTNTMPLPIDKSLASPIKHKIWRGPVFEQHAERLTTIVGRVIQTYFFVVGLVDWVELFAGESEAGGGDGV